MARSVVVSVVADAPDPDIKDQPEVKKVIWQLGKPIPGDANSTISRMFLIDGSVQVYAVPNNGTEFHQHGQALRFTIMSHAVRAVMELIPFQHLADMIQESEAMSEGIVEEDEDDDEEEDEEEPRQMTAAEMAQIPQAALQPDGMPPIPDMPLPNMPNT